MTRKKTRVLGSSKCNLRTLYRDVRLTCFSDETETDAMDEDAKPKQPEESDDLAKYNLDDYDNESKSIGSIV